MSGLKLLIDTNILIGLEDHRQIDASFSALQQKCHANGVQLWIHEASRTDIERDKDDPRKAIILSKIAKFNELTGIPLPSEADLVATYGRIKSQNDLVDVTLLHALHGVGAVDFLITQDRGIRKRAQTIGALNRVFTVEDALIWLRDTFERVAVNLPYIEEKQCHQIDRRDDIFQSLQDDYSGFEQWFSDNCVRNHRPCWVVTLDDELAGIAIHKDESFEDLTRDIPLAENNFVSPPTKILKICTFKIKEKYRGEKFGEQLLKQILWWCNKNAQHL